MHQDALIRKGPALEHWAIPIAIGALAILIGVVVGQGGWYYLPAVALLPILWFWPIEAAIGAAVILLPFEYVTSLGEGSDRTLMSLAVVLAFVVLCAVGVVARRLQRPSATSLWWGLFVAWSAVSILWAVEPAKSLERLPTAVALFLLYLIASSFRITEKEFDRIVSLAILGGGIAALLSVYGYYYGVGFAQHYVRATLVMGTGEVNPNRFGGCLLIPLSFALARLMTARHQWARILALGLFAIISLGLVLTMSRGTILAALVTITVFFWRLNSLRLKSLKPKVRRLLLLAIILAVVLGATVPATVFDRFRQSATDRGAGRLDIWSVGLVILKDYAVAGAGLNNFPVVYNKYAGYASHQNFKSDRDPHNVYLGVSVEEGLVGLFLFLMAVRTQLKLVSKSRAQNVESPIMLIACEATCWGVLVASVFGNFLWEKLFWLAWVLLAFALTIQAAKRSQEGTLIRRGQPI
jgi:O-antigen ligase